MVEKVYNVIERDNDIIFKSITTQMSIAES